MKTKHFKTIDEQLETLRDKGLVIERENLARELLLRDNYFFITGYRHPFYKSVRNKTFIDGTTFEELYALFYFDRHFRNIIFKNLLIVENNIKSIMSYQISKKYGHRDREYLKEENFTNDYKKVRQLRDIIKKMRRQIRVNGRKHTATMHYLSNYGYIPMWVLVKVLSFGIVSELYSVLKDEDRIDIARVYNMNVEVLGTYLPILANYRNVCAHEDILYENKTERSINNTRFHEELKIPKDEEGYIYGKSDLFAVIIILKQLLLTRDFKTMMAEIDDEIKRFEKRLKVIEMDKILSRMGFPKNYMDIAEL